MVSVAAAQHVDRASGAILITTVEDLIATLRKAQSELGPQAPIYLLIDDTLYGVVVQVNPKGSLGPGSVLLINSAPECAEDEE